MNIEIELTEEQAEKIKDLKLNTIGSGSFVIPAQIKIPNWDNSLLKPIVKGKLLTGDDAIDITKLFNSFMREYKEREGKDVQKDINYI